MTTSKLEQILRDNGYSTTSQRQRIFAFLQSISEPISVSELASRLDDINKVSVYRTIELFEKIGITHRIWSGFKSKVELSEVFSPHHHHFTCLNCGLIISLASDSIENELHNLEDKYDFLLTHHSVELTGYCKNCSKDSSQKIQSFA